MAEGFRYSVGSLGGLLLVFGTFLTLWRRTNPPDAAGATRGGAWLLFLAGAVLVVVALALPWVVPMPVPSLGK